MIFTSISPNTEANDVALAAKLFLSPWRWKKGPAVRELESHFAKTYKHAYAFQSGRNALFAILSALNLSADEEVLLQAYTCVAVPGPVLWAGATPVYVDVGNDLGIDPADLEKKITPKSRVLIIQHTFGVPAKIAELVAVARKHKLFIIEDCAHALGALYKSQPVGTFGDAAFFSFGRDKIISSVFGGVAVTKDSALAGKIQTIRDTFSCPSFVSIGRQILHPLIMSIAKPSYDFLGIGKIIIEISRRATLIPVAVESEERQGGQPSFIRQRMSNVTAVLVLHQLQKLPRYNAHRQTIAALYERELASVVSFQAHSSDGTPVWLRSTIFTEHAQAFFQEAKKRRIELGDWYRQAVAPRRVNYAKIKYHPAACPRAEMLANQSVNLPTHIGISEQDTRKIIALIKSQTSPELSGQQSRPLVSVAEMTEQKTWQDFLTRVKPDTFLHDWEAGEIERGLGRQIFRLGVYEKEMLVAVALFVKVEARRGRFLLCPQGPIIHPDFSEKMPGKMSDCITAFAEKAASIAKHEQCVFVRMSTIISDSPEHRLFFRKAGFKNAPIHVHSELSWLLDISLSEEVLLKGMKKNTRYSIRKAEKDGVIVRKSQSIADFETFWSIYMKTVSRQHFTPFPRAYLEKEFAEFFQANKAVLFIAEYQGKPISTAFVIYSNRSGFYHHGASDNIFPGITPSELVQWEAIKEAKSRGCMRYNFWGVVPDSAVGHPWYGLSKFKKSFGGTAHEYVHAQDLILSPRYYATWIIEKTRKIKRGV